MKNGIGTSGYPTDRARDRLSLIDTLRGLLISGMILYHAAMFGCARFCPGSTLFDSFAVSLIGRSGASLFILISGFCLSLSRSPVRRGAVVFFAGFAVTGMTALYDPSYFVRFGVLSFIGCAMMLAGVLKKPLSRIPGVLLFAVCAALIAVWHIARLSGRLVLTVPDEPDGLFRLASFLLSCVGFTQPGFVSLDYRPFLPDILTFLCGFAFFITLRARFPGTGADGFPALFYRGLRPYAFIGRHSLLIYLIHWLVLLTVFYII